MTTPNLYLLTDENKLTVEDELRLAHELAFAIGEADNEHEALGTVLARVCRATGWQMGQAWTWRDGCLRCCPAWYCDADLVEAASELRRMSLDSVLESDTLLPGLVWRTRHAQWFDSDAETQRQQFKRVQVACEAGLQSAFAVPVAAGDEMVAVLEFFAAAERNEDQRLLHFVTAVAVQLGSLLLRKRAEAALRGSEAELRALIHAITDLVLVLNSEGRYLKIAPTNNELLYKSAAKMWGKTLHDVLPSQQADDFLQSITQALEQQQTVSIEYSMEINDNTVWFDAHISPMSADRVVWVARDITERKHGELALERAEEQYRSIFENAVEGIFQTDAHGRYLNANPALAEIYGYDSPAELISQLTDISHQLYLEEGQREEFARLLARHDRVSKFESRVRRKDGSVIWISENARAVRNANGELIYYEGTVEDITDRKWQQRQSEDQHTRLQESNVKLQVLATIDSLTGLHNRRALQDKLRHECEKAQEKSSSLSILLLDVDRFKRYNDTFGHPAGDEVLRQLAHILKSSARETDFVARYGGEEFIAILPDTDRALATACAERFRKAIENAAWPTRPITASLGVATFDAAALTSTHDETATFAQAPHTSEDDDATSAKLQNGNALLAIETDDAKPESPAVAHHTALLASADKALYWSKANGRNCTTHADDL